MSCIATHSGLLYLHIPKCAGESIARYLLARCPDAFLATEPKCHAPLRTFDETLRNMHAIRAGVGWYRRIVAVVRNPYKRELSQWIYWREESQRRPGNGDFQIAAERTLEEFIRHPRSNHIAMDYWKDDGDLYRWWLNVDGEIPTNVQIIRLCDLETQLPAATDDFSTREADIPHVNASTHGPLGEYFTQGAIDAVEEKYRWTFDSGLYRRVSLADMESELDAMAEGVR